MVRHVLRKLGILGHPPLSPLQMIPLCDGKHLLPRRRVTELDKKCVVIDLDETLVHSSFKVCALAVAGTIGNRWPGSWLEIHIVI